MKFVSTDNPGLRIRRYSPGELLVDDSLVSTSVLLMSNRMESWDVKHIDDLDPLGMETLLAWEPDLIVLGTGPRLKFPEKSVRVACGTRGVGLEIMDTSAACRTFNLLTSDGRRALGALIV